MRSIVALCLPVLAFVAAAGGAALGDTHSSDPPGKLGIWKGRWSYSGRIYETPYSQAHSDSGTGDCNWTPSGGYMICDYFSTDPPHNDLSIFSYSSVAKAYVHVHIAKDSKPSRESVILNGNTWMTIRDIPYHGKTLAYRTVFVFLSANKQTTTVQISADGGRRWTTLIETTAVKVASYANRVKATGRGVE